MSTATTHPQRSTDKPHWYILGAGAIGCLWAANFRRAGFAVTLITRQPLSEKTLTLRKGDQAFCYDIDVVTPEEMLSLQKKIGHLLITTKAHQTTAALGLIKPAIDPETLLLVLQNGMAAKQVARLFAHNRVIAAITTDGAYRQHPTTVVHAGTGETFIGSYDGDDVSTVLDMLPTAFLTIQCCDDIEIRQWQKLIVNCAINGLTAIYHCRNGELLTNPKAMDTMEKLCNEATDVAIASGLPAERFVDLFLLARQTAEKTAENFSSMYKDIEQGRQTEIDALNGYLCAKAVKLNIPCPENRRIVEQIKALEVESLSSKPGQKLQTPDIN